jgi:predicted negative regulator of RcsB-dependent stress response
MKDSPILLLLVIGALGFIGWNWLQKQQATQTTALEQRDDKITTLEKTIKSLGDQLSDLAEEETETE